MEDEVGERHSTIVGKETETLPLVFHLPLLYLATCFPKQMLLDSLLKVALLLQSLSQSRGRTRRRDCA